MSGEQAAAVSFDIQTLIKSYPGEVEVQALRGVDLTLTEGEFCVLLGPSGSGKSTLLNILGGIDVPTSGRVLYRNEDLASFSDAQRTHYRRYTIGFVFQFYSLIPSLTARENVMLAAELVPQPLKPEEALEMVGLAHRLDHFPSQMSGGEQQRVAVARAIAKRPSVLLCDEPTGALDSATGVVVLEALASVSRILNTTTVLITHNAGIAKIAHRVVQFRDGRVVANVVNERRLDVRELEW
jgi:putative ABC transport system ATP-binding protein